LGQLSGQSPLSLTEYTAQAEPTAANIATANTANLVFIRIPSSERGKSALPQNQTPGLSLEFP